MSNDFSVSEEDRKKISRLSIAQRMLARSVIRSNWIDCQGCGEDALIGFRADRRLRGIDPMVIELLMLLAKLLIQYWLQNGIDKPSVVASELEPVSYEEVNDAD